MGVKISIHNNIEIFIFDFILIHYLDNSVDLIKLIKTETLYKMYFISLSRSLTST